MVVDYDYVNYKDILKEKFYGGKRGYYIYVGYMGKILVCIRRLLLGMLLNDEGLIYFKIFSGIYV